MCVTAKNPDDLILPFSTFLYFLPSSEEPITQTIPPLVWDFTHKTLILFYSQGIEMTAKTQRVWATEISSQSKSAPNFLETKHFSQTFFYCTSASVKMFSNKFRAARELNLVGRLVGANRERALFSEPCLCPRSDLAFNSFEKKSCKNLFH